MMLRLFFFNRRLHPYFFTITPFHSWSDTPSFSLIHSISSTQSFTFTPSTSATSECEGVSVFPMNALLYPILHLRRTDSSATRALSNVTKRFDMGGGVSANCA